MGTPMFVLASKSPRRRELLKKIGIQAEIMRANVDESSITDLPPEKVVVELALLKATDVAKYFRGNTYVIGADTVVCLDGEILGKPQNIDDAKECSVFSAERSTAYIQATVWLIVKAVPLCQNTKRQMFISRNFQIGR